MRGEHPSHIDHTRMDYGVKSYSSEISFPRLGSMASVHTRWWDRETSSSGNLFFLCFGSRAWLPPCCLLVLRIVFKQIALPIQALLRVNLIFECLKKWPIVLIYTPMEAPEMPSMFVLASACIVYVWDSLTSVEDLNAEIFAGFLHTGDTCIQERGFHYNACASPFPS
jgi:hypothetical protein